MEITTNSLAIGLDTVWVLLCAALVFFMEAGFACFLQVKIPHFCKSFSSPLGGEF